MGTTNRIGGHGGWIDAPREVRRGEEIDPESLRTVLAPILEAPDAPISIRQVPSGHSNLTYLVAVGAKEHVLRRPPFGYRSIKAGHDMSREYRILSGLAGRYPKAPRPVLFCDENSSPLGAPFYLMERVRGVILRPPLPAGLTRRGGLRIGQQARLSN